MIKTAYFQYNTKKKLSTLGDNLPATQIDKWYDAVYAHPDLKPVEPVMDQALNSLTNTDVIELYEAYAESTLAGIECLKSLLWKALNIPQAAPTFTRADWRSQVTTATYAEWVSKHATASFVEEEDSEMSYYYTLDSSGNFTESVLLIHPSALTKRPIISAICFVAEAAWRAKQAATIAAAYQADQTIVDLTADPAQVDRAQLYLLNDAFTINPDNSDIERPEDYYNQILKKEATEFGLKFLQCLSKIVFSQLNPAEVDTISGLVQRSCIL